MRDGEDMIKWILLFIIGITFLILDSTSLRQEKEIRNLTIKESLDVQESRIREEKLAEYVQALDYEMSVMTEREKK